MSSTQNSGITQRSSPCRPALVCLGEPLIEFNQRPGEANYLQQFGGDTSNCAIAAARQGIGVGYLSAVGADDFGQQLLELWRQEGVDAVHVQRHRSAPTGLYFVHHGVDGHRFSYRREGSAASLMMPADLPEVYLATASVLHVSGISQAISASACDTVFRAISLARQHGVMVSYDTNLRLALWPLARAKAVINAATALADIVLPSVEDARLLLGVAEPEAIVERYLQGRAQVVALTLGREGALVATPKRQQHIAGLRVSSVDATGAGDVFSGAFLAEYIATRDPFAAARYANAAAALATTGYGAVAPIPRREEVLALLATA